MNVMIFVENTRFIEDATAFIPIGTSGFTLATLTKNNYTTVANGLLLTWLSDFFANQTASNVYLVGFIADLADDTGWDATAVTTMKAAYDLVKTLAYWKTILVCTDQAPDVLQAQAVVDFVTYNNLEKLLSGPVMLPFTTVTPQTLESDPLYNAVVVTAGQDAYFCAHQDPTRHGGLFSLGIALSVVNTSGTSVGNSIDYVKTNLITASGPSGDALNTTIQGLLKTNNIQYFKPIGNSNGMVAAVGQKTIKGDYILANWIVAYNNFMNKVRTAETVTVMNFMRNSNNYAKILNDMTAQVGRFVASGRLTGYRMTAPAFANLPPSAGDEYVIPNAWSAWFVDNVRRVRVYGQLAIQG